MSTLYEAVAGTDLSASDDTALALMFGLPHCVTSVDAAVAERFKAIRPTLVEKKRGEPNSLNGRESFDEYCYDGCRTEPDSLGWRFAQYHGEPPVAEIAAGKWDKEIEWTWHEAASSEYWYRHEKDWGDF